MFELTPVESCTSDTILGRALHANSQLWPPALFTQTVSEPCPAKLRTCHIPLRPLVFSVEKELRTLPNTSNIRVQIVQIVHGLTNQNFAMTVTDRSDLIVLVDCAMSLSLLNLHHGNCCCLGISKSTCTVDHIETYGDIWTINRKMESESSWLNMIDLYGQF